jgi:hypothetical protein
LSSRKLKQRLQQDKISISDAIVEALAFLRTKESDETLRWLVNELQGYSNVMAFYSQPNHGLPAYRVVNGTLKLLGKNGEMANVDHELANRKEYFLGAPVSWLEEFASVPGLESVAELPELANSLPSGQVVLQLPRAQLQRVLGEVKARLLLLLDKDPKATLP